MGTVVYLESLLAKREKILLSDDVWTKDIGKYIKEVSHRPCTKGEGVEFVLQAPFTNYTLIANLSADNKIDGKGILRDPEGIVFAELTFDNGNLSGHCKMFTKEGLLFF